MNFRRLLAFAIVSGLLMGCGGSSGDLRTAHEVGVPKLRQDLRTLAQSPAGQQHEIPQPAWPESVRRFRPKAVELHMNRVLIVRGKAFNKQWGLLVMLDPVLHKLGCDLEPCPRCGAGYACDTPAHRNGSRFPIHESKLGHLFHP